MREVAQAIPSPHEGQLRRRRAPAAIQISRDLPVLLDARGAIGIAAVLHAWELAARMGADLFARVTTGLLDAQRQRVIVELRGDRIIVDLADEIEIEHELIV